MFAMDVMVKRDMNLGQCSVSAFSALKKFGIEVKKRDSLIETRSYPLMLQRITLPQIC